MALSTPPFAMQSGSHSAALFRQAVSSGIYVQGPISQTDLAVAAQSTPNMSVQVNPGMAWVKGTNVGNAPGVGWSTQGFYFALSDTTTTLTIATADTVNSRRDLVYFQITDTAYGGASNGAVLGVLTGTPSSNPATPATPANAIALARVAVGANVTTITSSNITTLSGPAGIGFTTPVYGSGYQAAAQTGIAASSTTGTNINIDTWVADTWSGAQSGGGWKAKYAGWYLISGQVGITNITGVATAAAIIQINGVSQIGGTTSQMIDPGTTSSQSAVVIPGRLFYLNAGDLVTLQGLCTVGPWNTITGAGTSWLTVARLYY